MGCIQVYIQSGTLNMTETQQVYINVEFLLSSDT